MVIGNLKANKPLLMAPLAGVSNRPLRLLAREYGAAVSFTEMISSEGIVRGQKRTLEMMTFLPDEQPIGIQLFGACPETLGRAAEITAREFKPDIIDINFGCPVKKVVNKNGGAGALKDLKLTRALIAATVAGAGSVPVTIKIRTGWDDSGRVFTEVGEIAQEEGVAAVTLHGRSRAKGFSGTADWDAIAELKRHISIPVIGNGDVNTPLDAARMFEATGCDGIMIGRAAMADPSVFYRLRRYLDMGELRMDSTLEEKVQLAGRHARLLVECFGEQRGTVMMRRYLGWYIRGFPGASALRPKLFSVNSLADIDSALADSLKRRGRSLDWLAGDERIAG